MNINKIQDKYNKRIENRKRHNIIPPFQKTIVKDSSVLQFYLIPLNHNKIHRTRKRRCEKMHGEA